jgi:hypothetical protein
MEPEEVAFARQWASKHAPTTTNMEAPIELQQAVFSMQSGPRL